VQEAAPALLYVPAAQSSQALSLTLPVFALYVPAAQLVQEPCPVLGL
jgi:hypothetical protein